MSDKVIITQEAQNDLEKITTYIIKEFQNIISADSIYFALNKLILQLKDFPFHAKYSKKYYRIKYKQYNIFYYKKGDVIVIVRILHSLQNIRNILED